MHRGRGYYRHKDAEADGPVCLRRQEGPQSHCWPLRAPCLSERLRQGWAGFHPHWRLCTRPHTAGLEASVGAGSEVRGLMESKTVQGCWVTRTWAFTGEN